MKKITIGIFNDSFFPMSDGVVMVVDNYARRLAEIANVVVFVPRYIGKDYDDSKLPYKVVRCLSLDVPFLDYTLPTPKIDHYFLKSLEEYNLDIVHIHSPFTLGITGVKYAKKHKIPCIATMHSQFKRDIKRAVLSDKLADKLINKLIKVFNKCDECWAVNKEVARIFFEEYHYKKMPRIINNATEMLPVENEKQARDYINKLYNIDDKDKVFLFVGRINILKNILFIVDSLKILKDSSPDYTFKMLFVGSGQDEGELKKHINRLNMNDNIILCGKVTDRNILAYYYARADLFLFPSLYDASSIVQIEAASQKTPTVFLKESATSATVTNMVNGILSENDPRKYAEIIDEVINDSKLYKKISDNAFNDLYKNWNDVIKDVFDLYLSKIKK